MQQCVEVPHIGAGFFLFMVKRFWRKKKNHQKCQIEPCVARVCVWLCVLLLLLRMNDSVLLGL